MLAGWLLKKSKALSKWTSARITHHPIRAFLCLRLIIQISLLGSFRHKSAGSTGRVNISLLVMEDITGYCQYKECWQVHYWKNAKVLSKWTRLSIKRSLCSTVRVTQWCWDPWWKVTFSFCSLQSPLRCSMINVC